MTGAQATVTLLAAIVSAIASIGGLAVAAATYRSSVRRTRLKFYNNRIGFNISVVNAGGKSITVVSVGCGRKQSYYTIWHDYVFTDPTPHRIEPGDSRTYTIPWAELGAWVAADRVSRLRSSKSRWWPRSPEGSYTLYVETGERRMYFALKGLDKPYRNILRRHINAEVENRAF